MEGNWKNEILYPEDTLIHPAATHPEKTMERLVARWLSDSDDRLDVLLDWCQGYGLPGVGHDREPYEWLLQGIPLGNRKESVEEAFAVRVRNALVRRPDLVCQGKRPEQILLNLFMLCAQLKRPEILSEILYTIFKDRKVKGKWLGTDVRSALLTALISNQFDQRLWEEAWKPILDRRHKFLPATPFDAFHGVRLMPSETNPGKPPIDEIGYTVKKLAEYIVDKYKNVKGIFGSYLERMKDTYADYEWGKPLIHQADKQEWPEWTFDFISDPVIVKKNNSNVSLIGAREHFELLFEKNEYNIKNNICHNFFLETTISAQQAVIFIPLAEQFAKHQQKNPFPSERARMGVYLQALIDYGLKKDDDENDYLLSKLNIVSGKIRKIISIVDVIKALDESLNLCEDNPIKIKIKFFELIINKFKLDFIKYRKELITLSERWSKPFKESFELMLHAA